MNGGQAVSKPAFTQKNEVIGYIRASNVTRTYDPRVGWSRLIVLCAVVVGLNYVSVRLSG